ncbi:HNH endonuclease signature motif containing protein [Glutamicibacter sp. TV12E]|uniref:HNH endonuclease signature motif containing protein n=1 Tax=Glutamicibacter sp. TV12E TaxID=3446362 RepID=UPI0040344577
MGIHQLAGTLTALRHTITGGLPRGACAVLLEIMAACCALLGQLSHALRSSEDPRAAAAHARLIETLFRYTVREQLQCAIHLESTAAHLLADEDLAAAREGTTDFSRPANLHSQRAHYRGTADFMASWLGLNFHEADHRVCDAHLLIARRAIDGSTLAPRLAKLAQLYNGSPVLDPRTVARAARALDKFEPADTAFEGLPLDATATHADGRTLEEHIVELFQEPDLATAQSRVSELIAAERLARKTLKSLQPGFYPRGTIGECDRYELIVAGAQREEFRSVIGQSDNPRTDAGKSARGAQDSSAAQEDHTGDHPNDCPDDRPAARDYLFSSDEPLPPWAQEPEGQPPEDQQSALAQGEQLEQNFADPGTADTGQQHGDAGPLADSGVPVPQRRLNALIAALKNRGSSRTGKTVAPRIAIHITLGSLADLNNPDNLTSISEHGVKLGPADTGQLICQGEIFRVIFGPDGQPLDLGRSERFFTEAMKRAIFARDRGCIVPGCTAGPEMLEYHHDTWWEHGGGTSTRNGSCLCRAHHHAIHAKLLALVSIGGLAHIILPKHLDPLQRPQRNRIHLAA